MQYQFDQIVDRRNTNSEKYDFANEHNMPDGLLPLWVADMDFPAPQEVITALVKRAQHGIFGYTDTKKDYFDTLHNWYSNRFHWNLQQDWLVKTPGVVFAICNAIRALTRPGDAVLIQRPVYYPFSLAILQNNRKLINNPLVYQNGAYSIDFDDFERKIADHNVKLFLLCSPHNPVGRVWSREELLQLGDICCRHNVLIVADEIHHDFIYEGFCHHVFADLKPAYLSRTITCTAPSKTFNLAGLQVSNIFIANPEIRQKFISTMKAAGCNELNALGIAAAQAAYTHGTDWLEQLRAYLAQNLAFASTFLKSRLPMVKLVQPQGTYLLWLDFSALGLSEADLETCIVQHAKLWLDAGTMFGPEGTNFQRLNIACPRKILETALTRLENALQAEFKNCCIAPEF